MNSDLIEFLQKNKGSIKFYNDYITVMFSTKRGTYAFSYSYELIDSGYLYDAVLADYEMVLSR